ncbi:hypothetical protein WA158_004735 [Blastocystis sp. Blastoise]
MDYLKAYKDDSEESESETVKNTDSIIVPPVSQIKRHVNINPDVNTNSNSLSKLIPTTTDELLKFNPKASELYSDAQGPENPFLANPTAYGKKNVLTGFVENTNVEHLHFKEQYQTYENYGYATATDGTNKTVGNIWKQEKEGNKTIYDSEDKEFAKQLKKQRVSSGNVDDVDNYLGPWAGYQGEEEEKVSSREKGEMTEWQKYWFEKREKRLQKEAEANGESYTPQSLPDEADTISGEVYGEGIPCNECKTKFHGKSQTDYQGHSWITAPAEYTHTDVAPVKCYIPKKCIHTWSGHTNAVQSIQFFPETSHLLLSASMDKKIKIWEVYDKKQCVRSAAFNYDGTQFLSASFDRNIKLWDTETGKCIYNYTKGTIPFQVAWSPLDHNMFIAPCQDCNAHQFDIRTGELIQTYSAHLGPVNTVTFFNDGKRFATTSDDKSILIWDYGINPPIKEVRDVSMSSMPSVTLSSTKDNLFCQSLNNQIVTYSITDDSVHQNGRKRFRGHVLQGYACQIANSPDGQLISCGDGNGNVYFWSYKSCKMMKMFKAHNTATVGCIWQPNQPSRMVTSCWDGTIKYWD